MAISIGSDSDAGHESISIGYLSDTRSRRRGIAIGISSSALGSGIALGYSADALADAVAIGHGAKASTSGLVIGAGANNAILSGQFNDTFDAVNGHLNILGDSLKVSGNGQVRVNDSYTFPTAVAGGSDYVLTAQTDGSTAWAAAAAGGSAAGSDTYVQFNDGGSSFGGESELYLH